MATITTSMRQCGPSLRSSRSSARPCSAAVHQLKVPVGFVRVASRKNPSTQARWRSSSWSNQDEAAMKELFDDLVGQWKVAANNSGGMAGGFFWPSGSYVYGNTGRCRPGNQQQENGTQAAAGTMQLGLDVVSTDGFYLLYADVPGLAKADLSIKLSPKDRVLKLSGERKAPADWESGSWQQKQRKFGSFERAWQLPEDADSQGISAKVTEGVLTVTVPKKQAEAEVEEVEDISIN